MTVRRIKGLLGLFELANEMVQKSRKYLDPNYAPGKHPETFAILEYGQNNEFELRGDTLISTLEEYIGLFIDSQDKIQDTLSTCKDILYVEDGNRLRLAGSENGEEFHCYKKKVLAT